MRIVALIPARLESTRLPGKPLLDINGMPMVIHVAKRALFSESIDSVAVCTDSLDIMEECIKYKVPCILTKKKHSNGTERVAEAINNLDLLDDDIVIDIQGDEPLIHPSTIDKLVSNFKSSHFDIMLPYIETSDTNNLNIVKVSTTGNQIIYMSRIDIPYAFSQDRKLKKHLSIVAFTVSALKKFSSLKNSELEKIEGIELLRALEGGSKIGTFKEDKESTSVDVIEDYQRVNRRMRNDKLYNEYKEHD